MTFGEASRRIAGWPNPMVRSALLHLMWSHYFDVDLSYELTPSHLLRPGAPR